MPVCTKLVISATIRWRCTKRRSFTASRLACSISAITSAPPTPKRHGSVPHALLDKVHRPRVPVIARWTLPNDIRRHQLRRLHLTLVQMETLILSPPRAAFLPLPNPAADLFLPAPQGTPRHRGVQQSHDHSRTREP